MKSVQLYKLLQQHAARINTLAVQLYNAGIETDDAFEKALAEVERVRHIMTEAEKD